MGLRDLGGACAPRAKSRFRHGVGMTLAHEALDELERGAPPVASAGEQRGRVVCSADVALLWARALGLRPGNTQGPSPADLQPLVDVWAAERGMTGPGLSNLGLGLTLAGLRRRRGRRIHTLLHRDDVARLRASMHALGVRPPLRKAGRKPLPRVPRVQPHIPDFHTALHKVKRKAPLVDSMGRVWPSAEVAARVLGGHGRSPRNALRNLRYYQPPTPDTSRLTLAARTGDVAWRGVLWRHLTPAEVEAIPQGTLSGTIVRAYGWGLACPRCGCNATVSA
jgi:hypothetical protein